MQNNFRPLNFPKPRSLSMVIPHSEHHVQSGQLPVVFCLILAEFLRLNQLHVLVRQMKVGEVALRNNILKMKMKRQSSTKTIVATHLRKRF